MAVDAATERRVLGADERDAVAQSRYPEICALSAEDLRALTRRVRSYRDKARDTARQQRREMRGKSEPRGARPARDNTGTKIKQSIFAGALKRLNREIARHEAASRRESQGEIAQRALAMKRANRVRHHPSAGRTAGKGMRPNTSDQPTVEADPREVGRVSQFVKNAQARRDG